MESTHAITNRSVCLLISGGLDSAVLMADLLRAGNTVWPIYVRFGFSWEESELAHTRRFIAAIAEERLRGLHVFGCRESGLYEGHWAVTGEGVPAADSHDEAVYLPGRNVLLLAIASAFCARHAVGCIALGTLDGNPFADATGEFFAAYAKAVSLGLGLEPSIEIAAPYAKTRKVDLVRRAAGLPLEWTFSCLRPVDETHCGRCNKCEERRRAFRAAGVVDPTRYADA